MKILTQDQNNPSQSQPVRSWLFHSSLLPISSNSPIPIVHITITRYTVTIPRFPRRSAGRKSEQHKRKQHEDNRQKYHTILSKSHLYTGKIPEYHRQIHPRHPHLHRLAADTGTERHHQKSSHKNAKTKCEYVSFGFFI